MKLAVDKPIAEKDESNKSDEVEQKETEKANLPAVLVTPHAGWQGPSEDIKLDQEIVRLYIDDLRDMGYQKGTVVVPANLFQENRIDPTYWGFIVGYNDHHIPGNLKKLLKVRWGHGGYEDLSEKNLRIVYRPFWKDQQALIKHLMSATTYP